MTDENIMKKKKQFYSSRILLIKLKDDLTLIKKSEIQAFPALHTW